MKHLKLVTVLAVVAAFGGAAFGDTITFNSPSGVLGTSQVYNPGPNSITAYGFSGISSPVATDLYGKNAGGTESGLGIASNSQFEIDDTHFVQLDLSNIASTFSLQLGSTQANEGYKICFSSAVGTFGTVSCTSSTNAAGTDPIVLALSHTGADPIISITATGTDTANILVDSISFRSSPVPEPSSLLLFGTGILAAAGVVRRKLHI